MYWDDLKLFNQKHTYINIKAGAPAMAQWVKNPTAAAWVAEEMQLRFQWVKGSCLLQLRQRLQLWFRFSSWPGNFHMPWVWSFKKNKIKRKSNRKLWSSRHGSVVSESDWEPRGFRFNPWPCSVSWGSGIVVSCGLGRRLGSDLVLLRLWCRPAAKAPIRPLAWKPPYATGAAIKKAKDQKKKKKSNRKHIISKNFSKRCSSWKNKLFNCPYIKDISRIKSS